MKKTRLGLAICLALGLGACGSPITPPPSETIMPATDTAAVPTDTAPAAAVTSTSVTPTQGPQPIGNVERKTDVVEHGSTANALAQLLGTADLFQGDVLKIHDGGEGLLNFDNQLSLELFNDSQLGVVSSTPPGTPLDIQIALTDGGFTGQLTTQGGRAVFTTPSGAQITILGTDFLIAYDPVTHVTTAGNFHGTVQVASAGVQVALASGSAVVVPAEQAPGAQFPVTFTLAQFQQQARALKSPVAAANQNLSLAGSETLALSNDHTCAVVVSGGLRCWGNNNVGQLGDGTTNPSTTPVNVLGLRGRVVQVAIATTETCAVNQDGAAFCWGSNENRTIELKESHKPAPLTWPSGPVLAVAPGNGFTCVLTAKGGVECVGNDSFGQVGDGSLTSGAVAITSGLRDHTCVLMLRGGVRCWGSGSHGELGNGVDGDSKTPVDVPGLASGVAAIAAGAGNTCVRMTNGGLKCWGDNANGQLGDGSTTYSETPVDVVGYGPAQ